MSSRTILLDAVTSLSSRTTTRRLNSKRIARSIENFQQSVDVLEAEEETDSFEASKFLEICCSLPVVVSMIEAGGPPQLLKVHNYLVVTLNAATTITLENTSTTEKCEINLIYA